MFTLEWKSDKGNGASKAEKHTTTIGTPRRRTSDATSDERAIDKRTKSSSSNYQQKKHQRHHHRSRRAQSEQDNGSAMVVSSTHHHNAMQTTSIAALGALAAYFTLRGSVKLFHHARRSLLRQLLLDLAPVLHHTTYWLDFGSLLGLYRDGDLILHDNDIDLAIYRPDWPELTSHLKESLPQYCVRMEYPSEAPDVCFLRVYCSMGFADLFGAVEIGDGRVLVDCGHGDVTSIDAELVLPTDTLQWRETTIKVPKDLPGTLHARYGPTWHVPRYLDKGADTVEGNKTYAKIFRALSKVGIAL